MPVKVKKKRPDDLESDKRWLQHLSQQWNAGQAAAPPDELARAQAAWQATLAPARANLSSMASVTPMPPAGPSLPPAGGNLVEMLASLSQRSPEGIRGGSFREHVMGPAFNAPQQRANPEAEQSAAIANAWAKDAELKNAGSMEPAVGKKKIRVTPGGDPQVHMRVPMAMQDQHIEMAKARMEAMNKGVPENKLPPMVAIGGGSVDATRREQDSIAAAGERRQARRIKVKDSPQAEAVAQRGQDRAQARKIRVHGASPKDFAVNGQMDPMALMAMGRPGMANMAMQMQKLGVDRQGQQAQLAMQEKLASMEGQQAMDLLNRQAMIEGKLPGISPQTQPGMATVNLKDPAAMAVSLHPDGVPLENMTASDAGSFLDRVPMATIAADPMKVITSIRSAYGEPALEELVRARANMAGNFLYDMFKGERTRKIEALLTALGRLRDGQPVRP